MVIKFKVYLEKLSLIRLALPPILCSVGGALIVAMQVKHIRHEYFSKMKEYIIR
jgi:hypothetical protein